jgi:hypothetical protein
LCISVSSADAERAFSLVNNVKSKLRSCLGASMLDALCLIASEGPAEDDFEYEEAVEFWHGKKDRRVSLFVKAKHQRLASPLLCFKSLPNTEHKTMD